MKKQKEKIIIEDPKVFMINGNQKIQNQMQVRGKNEERKGKL